MTAAQLELITAAVDGELSLSEVGAFRVLLTHSPAARELFGQLKADSLRINALPRVATPSDLHAKVLAHVARATHPAIVRSQSVTEPLNTPVSLPKSARRLTRRVPALIAASVLVCVTAGSFVFFRDRVAAQNQFVSNSWANVLPAPSQSASVIPSPNAVPAERIDSGEVVRVPVTPVPPMPAHPAAATAVAIAPSPRALDPDYIASPFRTKVQPFDRIEIRVPFLRSLSELGREDIGQELLDCIGRDPARLDLFVRDTARGVEVFQNAARVSGIMLHTDGAALDKIKKKQSYSVMIYTESLSAAELVALFENLSVADSKYSPRVCKSLHVTTIVRSDELELKAILGQDVGIFKRPLGGNFRHGVQQGTERVPAGKPIHAGTLDQLVQAVTSSPGSPLPKSHNKNAVLLTWQAIHPSIALTNPASSIELKRYLQLRGERKPNAVPAIIVIRPIG